MIAADTSAVSAYLGGDAGADVELLEESLRTSQVVFPPAVLTELLSEPQMPRALAEWLRQIPLLEITDGYWERAGLLRAKILRAGLKSRLPDVLIAQSCIDHHMPLITRDLDFRHYVRVGGLKKMP